MIGFSIRLTAIALLTAALATAASAHTADISSGRIVPEPNNQYRVDVGFLGTDWGAAPTSSACFRRTQSATGLCGIGDSCKRLGVIGCWCAHAL